MNRLHEYRSALEGVRAGTLDALRDCIASPMPSFAEYGGLYHQVDGRTLMPVSLSWMTVSNEHQRPVPCPFSKVKNIEWIWHDTDLDQGLHEDAEEIFFEWLSECWKEVGGEQHDILFVIYDHASMDIIDLSTLTPLTDREIREQIGA